MTMLLAENGGFLHLGDHFRAGGSNFSAASLATVAFVAAVIALAIWIASRRLETGERRKTNSAGRLMHELCQAHRLTHAQRRLLGRVARQAKLVEPALVFVDRTSIDAAIAKADVPRAKRELELLRKILFATTS
ncbi:MAG: hypothetical protein SFU86_09395 [Pirellulaceae bacterium]|nr:hypothetical protein [Pirellulaceae bacterium]